MEVQLTPPPVTADAAFVVTMPDGSARRFVQRTLTAGVMAAYRRVEGLYREQCRIGAEADVIASDLTLWLEGDRGLLNYLMQEVYAGDHSSIDWYEQPHADVFVMVNFFFMRWFATSTPSSSASPTSSSTSDTSSTSPSGDASDVPSSTAGSTKKQRGESPKARKTTTTS